MSSIPTFIYKDFEESTTYNYNKVWNWYLNNLKNGEFEQLLHNTKNSTQLDKFIDDLNDGVTLILIIPNIINSTILLRDLLTKFFEQNGSQAPIEVTITNLGLLKQSQSSIIVASSNFINNTDLKSQQFSFGPLSNYNQAVELNSIISGESGYTPSETDQPIEPTAPTTISSLSHNDMIDDSESSIDSFHPSGSIPPSPKYSLTRVTTIQNDGSLTHVPNTPNSSEINSPLIQVETKESEDIGTTDDEEGKDDVESSSFVGDVESHDVNSVVYSDDSSIESLDYVPSMITARTKKLNVRYKLILNNILFRDENKERRTAIRQNDEDGMCDDWLLYDSNFRMDNLQLLDLRGVLEMMKFDYKKLLFYDLVLEKMDNQQVEEDEDFDEFEGVQENDLNVVEFNGKEEVDEHEDDEEHGDHDDEYGTEGTSIRFTQSNQTTITPSIKLTKTNTTNTIKTNYGSIKSEMNLYKPDSMFSRVERSKSTPNNNHNNAHSNTRMKKFKLKHGNNSHSSDRCVIV